MMQFGGRIFAEEGRMGPGRISPTELPDRVLRRLFCPAEQDALESLGHRSPVERGGHGTFTLQPVVLEYLTGWSRRVGATSRVSQGCW